MLRGTLVKLRPIETTDLERYLAWINDPEVTRWISARYPISRAQEEEWLSRVVRQRPEEAVSLAIETLADSRHIGSVDLSDRKPEDRSAMLGIMIGEKECWGRGYGTDAIRTLLAFGFDEMNLHRVHLTVDADNARALACYRKCGFVEEGRLRQDRFRAGRYVDTLVMGVLEEEFRAPTAAENPRT